MKKITAEQMRYKVPGVANHFWKTHARFILLCVLVAATIFIAAVGFSATAKVTELSPKKTFVFFCEVDDYQQAQRLQNEFFGICNVYFVHYDDRFVSNDDSSAYNLSMFSNNIAKKYSNPDSSLAGFSLTYSGTGSDITYNELNQEEGAVVPVQVIREYIRSHS